MFNTSGTKLEAPPDWGFAYLSTYCATFSKCERQESRLPLIQYLPPPPPQPLLHFSWANTLRLDPITRHRPAPAFHQSTALRRTAKSISSIVNKTALASLLENSCYTATVTIKHSCRGGRCVSKGLQKQTNALQCLFSVLKVASSRRTMRRICRMFQAAAHSMGRMLIPLVQLQQHNNNFRNRHGNMRREGIFSWKHVRGSLSLPLNNRQLISQSANNTNRAEEQACVKFMFLWAWNPTWISGPCGRWSGLSCNCP